MSFKSVLNSCITVGASVYLQKESISKENRFLFNYFILKNSENFLTLEVVDIKAVC